MVTRWSAFIVLAFAGACQAADQPPVRAVVHDLRCDRNSLQTSEAIGEIENVGTAPMDSAWLVVGFYDRDGRLIDSADSVADIRPLLPDQRSPFKVYGPTNPLVAECRVVAVKDGPYRPQVRFESRTTPTPTSWRPDFDPMKYYKCPSPDGSIIVQHTPCQ